MRYISTRGEAPSLNFDEAMLSGLARDGGLYLPETWPQFSKEEIALMASLSYEEVVFKVIKPFIGDSFSDQELKEIIARAYEKFGHVTKAPLKQLDANVFLLELFHGPTLAFKDMAMQLIGKMFEAVLKRANKSITIVGATSGDTGSAAIEAFKGLDGVDVFILYPHGMVSEVQRRQMTTILDENITAIAVEGNFDDCQARLKDMFNDHSFRDEVQLAGVNSINWARILSQVVYYFTSAVALGAPHRSISFSVPTGNFGDIYAGYIAKKMGLPIDRLIIATNQNDILHRTLKTGKYIMEGVKSSISPSMDIQVSSNFERLLFGLLNQNGSMVSELMDELNKNGGFILPKIAQKEFAKDFDSASVSEEETFQTIKQIYDETGELLCPHSAIGVKVAKDFSGKTKSPIIALATAHPAKFPDAVSKATGKMPDLPAHLTDLFEREERIIHAQNDGDELQALIKKVISK